MAVPHIFGGLRVTADISFASAAQSARRPSSAMLAMYSSTLASVSVVLFAFAMGSLASDARDVAFAGGAAMRGFLRVHRREHVAVRVDARLDVRRIRREGTIDSM